MAIRLTKEEIVSAALTVLDEVGIDGLTTRRVADQLGIQSPTLYWHFKNKRALLDAMAYRMMGEVARPDPADFPDWRSWLRAEAEAFRTALARYRDGAKVHAGSSPGPEQVSDIDHHITYLCNAGFSPGDAARALFVLGRFVVGWMIEAQSGESRMLPREILAQAPFLERAVAEVPQIGGPDTFLWAVDTFIKGMSRHHPNDRL
ncbi:TetR family transcriptional regulator [Rhizobium vallis]|uniref:TetR family transcriptional regulator n=1 Tax=Rhizobium vallis TaxID=634290 RepID=A0A3S0QR35_9HYPH|nr:TetR/AcrR family transcriptional regulator C-terminal domain-containing protein [Rhizobium vallis]RUM20445.1 TetR family transcriptional regulator [Rhizobium vallis]